MIYPYNHYGLTCDKIPRNAQGETTRPELVVLTMVGSLEYR